MFYSIGKDYGIVNGGLLPWQWTYIVCAIQRFEGYEINDLSHIVIMGTDIEVGYISQDTFELVEPNNPAFTEHHNNIKLIYDSALRGFYKDKRQRKKDLVDFVFS